MNPVSPHTLDVRPLLEKGREPFMAIMEAKEALRQNQELHLIAPFEPLPLMDCFRSDGFTVESRQIREGEWHIRLIPPHGNGGLRELDLRDLEPPGPLHRALEATAELGRGETLAIRTRFRPVHLFEQLEDNGYEWESEEIEGGHWLSHVWRSIHY